MFTSWTPDNSIIELVECMSGFSNADVMIVVCGSSVQYS
jgi:hypothetical protein